MSSINSLLFFVLFYDINVHRSRYTNGHLRASTFPLMEPREFDPPNYRRDDGWRKWTGNFEFLKSAEPVFGGWRGWLDRRHHRTAPIPPFGTIAYKAEVKGELGSTFVTRTHNPYDSDSVSSDDSEWEAQQERRVRTLTCTCKQAIHANTSFPGWFMRDCLCL